MDEGLVLLISENLRRVADERSFSLPTVLQRDTPLFGEGGIVDSLGLVTLIVSCEQAVEDEWGITISLADEKALSQRRTPFATLGSMADYIRARMQAEGWNG